MNDPQLSIIIPTHNRPHLLPRAVNSALAQTVEAIEVIVVDDGSEEPVSLPEHPRVRTIRLPENKGCSAARNIGAKAARGRWISYLDDDDELLPHMAATAIAALENTTLPPPVALLSGLETVDRQGNVTQKRLPPTLPKGCHFFLEPIPSDRSFFSKQTLVVERQVLLDIGGFDESFSSRVYTELFLRLNPACSILGVPAVTYRLTAHEGPRISRDPSKRQVNFQRLIRKHGAIFQAHPQAFAEFLYQHARRSQQLGQTGAAIAAGLWALQLAPRKTLGRFLWPLWMRVRSRVSRPLGQQM